MKLFVPGRLCLFGEHTDWAGHYRTMNADINPGAAIVTGIEQGIYAESGMGCTGPVVMVNEAKAEKAAQILKEKNFIA